MAFDVTEIRRIKRALRKSKTGFKELGKIFSNYERVYWSTMRITRVMCIGYHMGGEVISVLSLEGRYYNCHERAQRTEGQL